MLGLFVFITTGPCGSRPIVLSLFYNIRQHPLTGAILHLLIHCPSLHAVLLSAVKNNSSKLLVRLLQYAQWCANRCRNMSQIRNSQTCQSLLRDELPLSDRLLNDPCVETVRVLTSFSSSIYSLPFSSDMNLNCLSFPSTADIVFIYRNSTASAQCYQSPLPDVIDDRYLTTVLGGNNLTETVYFRWNERYSFWHVLNDTKGQTSTMVSGSEVIEPSWRILVYARRRQIMDIDNSMAMNLNGQRRMWCNVHRQFLIKQSVHCQLFCCVQGCTRNARWSCLGEACPVRTQCVTHMAKTL